jgi:hypothetical protein
MPAGTFLGKGVDALPVRAGLESAGQSGSVSLGLSTKRLAGIIPRLVSVLHHWAGGRSVGVSRGDADRDRTVAPAARLALRVELGLRVGLSLRLLQTSALASRCADLTAPQLADAPS